MNKKTLKRQQDLKTKLMAAISMLLVSSLMMVTSTYAWFTLSTAPEVTGITTAVGANGNLEMALIPTDGLPKGVAGDYGITTEVGDSAKDASLKNITWGNLVDLSDNTFYGMDKLTLYPSELNVATWDDENTKLNPTQIAGTILSTPVYGSDGRISSLSANTTTSTFSSADKVFPQNSENGVRAVGTASGMTDRQLAYRNYRSSASTAMAQAKTFASQSLNINGAALANIALAHGVDDDATHSQKDVTALLAIVDDLLGTDDTTGVLEYIENAYKYYVIAYAASNAFADPNGDKDTTDAIMNDTAFKAFQNEMEALGTIEEVIAYLNTNSITIQDPIGLAMSALVTTKATVKEAQTGLLEVQAAHGIDATDITWSEISTPLHKLANTDRMKINGYEASTVKDNLNAIVGEVAKGGGLKVTISTGGGVYADVADHCGDFNAQINIDEVTYGGTTLTDMPARMETNTTVDDGYGDVYLGILSTVVTNAKEPVGAGQTMPITDFFGYIIDLGFKTNAAESNLLLATTPVDRIYKDGGNEETMGHGATMTFTSTTTDFTATQLAELMDAIRIVFFDPSSNEVFATAKLDMANGAYTVVGGNTITANIYLYENVASATTYREATNDETATHVAVPVYREALDTETATHILDADGTTYREPTGDETATHVIGSYNYVEAASGATHVAVTVAGGAVLEKDQTKAVITALTQNTAKAVSVLVYLDGRYVTNADVAATAETSMTGSMNLQFSSSANLTPMNYTPLMEQGDTATGSGSDSNSESGDANNSEAGE